MRLLVKGTKKDWVPLSVQPSPLTSPSKQGGLTAFLHRPRLYPSAVCVTATSVDFVFTEWTQEECVVLGKGQ